MYTAGNRGSRKITDYALHHPEHRCLGDRTNRFSFVKHMPPAEKEKVKANEDLKDEVMNKIDEV